MNKASEWIVLGRFGRPQGLKGLIRINSFTDPEQSILDYAPWYIKQDHTWAPVSLVNTLTQNNLILAQVVGYTEREQVAMLTHVEIGVPQSQLPKLPSGEYYWHELHQMRVINQDGTELGSITDIIATGSNDVLIVSGEKKHLIPYLQDIYVLSVDPVQQQMIVDWDEDF